MMSESNFSIDNMDNMYEHKIIKCMVDADGNILYDENGPICM
jgi:hypothetical protein